MKASRPSVADRSTGIEEDVACAFCGYNLKHLRRNQRCPECARRVARTLRLWRLSRLGDPLIVELKTATAFLIGGGFVACLDAATFLAGACAGAVGLGACVLLSSLGTLAFAIRSSAILSARVHPRPPMRFLALTVLTLACGLFTLVCAIDDKRQLLFLALTGAILSLASLHAASAYLGIRLGIRFRQPAIERWAAITFGLAFAAAVFQLAQLTVIATDSLELFGTNRGSWHWVDLLFAIGPLTTGISIVAAAGMGWAVRRWCNRAMHLYTSGID